MPCSVAITAPLRELACLCSLGVCVLASSYHPFLLLSNMSPHCSSSPCEVYFTLLPYDVLSPEHPAPTEPKPCPRSDRRSRSLALDGLGFRVMKPTWNNEGQNKLEKNSRPNEDDKALPKGTLAVSDAQHAKRHLTLNSPNPEP